VAVTKGGKLFAMDSANGDIVWSRNLGLMLENGPELTIFGMWLVRELGELGSPTMAVLAEKSRGQVRSARKG